MKRTGNRNKNFKRLKPAFRIICAASILLMLVLLFQYGAKCFDKEKAVKTTKETIRVKAANTASPINNTVGVANVLARSSGMDMIDDNTRDYQSKTLIKKEPTVPEYTVTVYEDDKDLYTNELVNIRKGAGTDFDKVATVTKDTKVDVIGETDNGWYQVAFNDEVGYIKSDFLQEQAPEPQPEPGAQYIFAGDSRTVQMSKVVKDVDYEWIAKVGEGYSYFANEAVPKIDADAGKGSIIIINYGVNDLYNVEKYIKLINKKVDSWIDAGATVYYAAVTPVSNYPTITNSDIEKFNNELKSGLDERVGWLDGYSYLQNTGFSTGDGLHYNNETYKTLYTYYISEIAAQKEA